MPFTLPVTHMNLTTLLEKEVYDSEMKLIGTLKDVSIDPESHTIKHLAIRLDQNLANTLKKPSNPLLEIKTPLIQKLGDVILLNTPLESLPLKPSKT